MRGQGQEEQKTGRYCQICTGCGRCFEPGGEVVVVTDGLADEWRLRWTDEWRLRQTDEWQQQTDEWRWKNEEASGADALPAQSVDEKDWLAAVDIGTTTVAMLLFDERGRQRDRFVAVNPQVKYGADVISRIRAAKAPEAAEQMRTAVEEVLCRGLEQFCTGMECAAESGARLRVFVAGNTTMLYLLRGLSTEELGHAPFRADFLQAAPMEWKLPRATAKAMLLPGLSAFVGADILAGIFACGMAEEEKITLLIDLGTNGEMVIGNRDRLIACSTAAGPAFEGGATRGIWGADMIRLTARLLEEGLLDETGLLADPYFEEGIRIGGVKITQQHIRQLQLAKGAIAAGIRILTECFGLTDPAGIDRVVLAGGFGYFLKAADAARIGLLPEELVPKVESAGNTALAGALRYGLMRGRAEADLERIRSKTRILNLAECPSFQERFVEAMNLEPWGHGV